MSIPESVLQRITNLEARQRELDGCITHAERGIEDYRANITAAKREMALLSERLEDIRTVCEAFMGAEPDADLNEDWGEVWAGEAPSEVRSNKDAVLEILRRADRPMRAIEVRDKLGSQASQYLTRLKHENLVVHEGNLWSAA